MSEVRPTLPQALGRLRVALDMAYLAASRDLGLTPQQAEMLCAALSPTAVGDLARALRCDRSNVSHLVERAERRGLVRRRTAPDDGRVTLIELTAEGRLMAERFIAALEAQTSALRARWGAERSTAAAEIIESIATALEHRPSTTHRAHR